MNEERTWLQLYVWQTEHICGLWWYTFRMFCILAETLFPTRQYLVWSRILETFYCDWFHPPPSEVYFPKTTLYVSMVFSVWVHMIKTYISNLVRTTHFWNNRHQICSKSKDWSYLKTYPGLVHLAVRWSDVTHLLRCSNN